jgi:UDP-glucuronate 4-epimerase
VEEWNRNFTKLQFPLSVYGKNPSTPWREDCSPLLPISPYASTKLSGELMGHVYRELYGLRFVALRFFTVYGPRQRPDLAISKFARLILDGKPVPVYGKGETRRDYTYVADICSGIVRAMSFDRMPFEVFNVGSDRPVQLLALVAAIGNALGRSPVIEFLQEQPGDVPQTWASLEKSREQLGYSPQTSLESGLRQFAAWLVKNENADARRIA